MEQPRPIHPGGTEFTHFPVEPELEVAREAPAFAAAAQGKRPLGFFYCPAHDYAEDHRLIEKVQPAIITIQDGGPPHYDWIRKASPNSTIIAREWALGNELSDLEANPEKKAKHDAEEWAKKRDVLKFDPERTYIAPVNEFPIWPDLDPEKTTPEQREAQRLRRVKALNTYSIAYAYYGEKYGHRVGVGKFSHGWPGNHGIKDAPPDWSEFEEMHKGINWKRHALIVHEYFAELGPAEHWGWWAGASRKCPWNVPLIIGETGLEMAVKKSVIPAMRGWSSNLKDDAQSSARQKYVQMMLDYCNWMAVDPRLIGINFFMLDHQDPQWSSQDYHSCVDEIIARLPEMRGISTEPFVPLPASVLSPDKFKQPGGTPVNPPVTPPVVVPPITPPVVVPPVTPTPVTAITGKVISAKPNDGTTYIYGQAPSGATVYFAWRGNDAIDGIKAGPHAGYENWPTGYFNIPLYIKGQTPCVGDWDVWASVNGITSARVQFHSDGRGGKANQFEVTFALVSTPVTPPVTPPVVVPPVTPPAASSVLRWPLDVLNVTQWFGENPAAYARFGLRGHNGLDLSCVVGTPVKAAAEGVVAYVDTDADYGNYVRIWHKALRCHTFYAHLSAQKVKQGDTVTQGQVIGLSGNTGNSTGPHLHFEVRPCDAAGAYTPQLPGYGKACDPVAFVAGLDRAPAGSAVFLPFVQR